MKRWLTRSQGLWLQVRLDLGSQSPPRPPTTATSRRHPPSAAGPHPSGPKSCRKKAVSQRPRCRCGDWPGVGPMPPRTVTAAGCKMPGCQPERGGDLEKRLHTEGGPLRLLAHGACDRHPPRPLTLAPAAGFQRRRPSPSGHPGAPTERPRARTLGCSLRPWPQQGALRSLLKQ